jgi:hypothetical protein
MTWQVGPTVLTCHADWSLTCCLYMLPSCLHHDDVTLGMLLCMLTSQLCHVDVILIRVSHVGRVSPSRWRRLVGRVCARGQPPFQRVTARADVSDVRVRRGFHPWLRLFLLYTVVWSKHNFDNFHFWAKIKHHFKPNDLIPIVGKIWPVMFW